MFTERIVFLHRNDFFLNLLLYSINVTEEITKLLWLVLADYWGRGACRK